MKINLKSFQLTGDKKVNLNCLPTMIDPYYQSKKDYEKLLSANIKELADLQQIFYAANKQALLLIFQGMDSAGKDGVIRHLLSGVNPQGCEVYSFKAPSQEELEHDFLWRTTLRLPRHGRIGVFNRSYYEEVLIVKVHPNLLTNQGYDLQCGKEKTFWNDRYQSILNFENHLFRNHTNILKFYLHLSQEEQKKRFIERIDNPNKNWKFSASDSQERKYWPAYINAYEECFKSTATKTNPWYIVPADDKYNARLIISQIVLEAVRDLQLEYPKVSYVHSQELQTIRKSLSS